jgi:hypothetical protein
LLCPVKHRSAPAQADLTVIRARAGLVRSRTALVNTARSLAKSYGQRLHGCNVRNMNQRGDLLVDAEPAPTRIRRLFQEALEQDPGGMPFLTFIDVNLPLTPKTPPMQRSWVQEAMRCFEEMKQTATQKLKVG